MRGIVGRAVFGVVSAAVFAITYALAGPWIFVLEPEGEAGRACCSGAAPGAWSRTSDPPRQGRADHHHEVDRGEHQARQERWLPQRGLEHHRDEEHRARAGHAGKQPHEVAAQEEAPPEEAQRHHRVRHAPLDEDEAGGADQRRG